MILHFKLFEHIIIFSFFIYSASFSRNLTSALGRCGEMVEFLMQNILSYNCDLLHSALLHDPASHDWTNVKPYHENEKFSESIQMWAFYMQGADARQACSC